MRPPTRLRRRVRAVAALATATLLAPGLLAAAELRPSSDLLLPYFEVALDGDCRTTYVAVGNEGSEPVDVTAVVHSNWGIPVLTVVHRLPADAVWTFNLRDWLLLGRLPDERTLAPEQVAGLQAALAGEPVGGLFYGTARGAGGERTAVGYVTLSTAGSPAPDVLWGDSFVFCPQEPLLQGETLVDVDPVTAAQPRLCRSHAIRFLESAFPHRTELMVWTPVPLWPAETREAPVPVPTTVLVYAEDGRLIAYRELALLPSDRLRVADLELEEAFGWLVITSPTGSFVAGHYTLRDELGSSLHAWCLPRAVRQGPALQLEKRVEDDDADSPPGPSVGPGDTLRWTFVVTNDGSVPLADVAVDDPALPGVTCPQRALDPGDSMTCTASGAAGECQQHNVATAVGFTPAGTAVEASDGAYYLAASAVELRLEALVHGEEADAPKGPQLQAGDPVSFAYWVVNDSAVAVSGVAVADDTGLAVSCPQTALAAGEEMVCNAATTAAPGQRVHHATVTAEGPCAETATALDPAYYFGLQYAPAIDLEKLTNGGDADLEPGPTLELGSPVQWSYVVTNAGDTALANVTVTDDRGVAVTCPKTALEPGESMTCTGSGVAQACQYANLGTVTAEVPVEPGLVVSDLDPSHYFGQANARIGLQKRTEDQDANTPPGPDLLVGTPVHWTYLVSNFGDVPLTAVVVADEYDVVVICPKTALAPGESMTCTGQGIAVAGQYRNLGSVSGQPPCGAAVTATDPSHYYGRTPDIGLEKLVNGQGADAPPYPVLRLGDPLLWTYVVTNTGDIALTSVTVTDDRGVAVACPKTILSPGESMTCVASGTAVAGQYTNTATATGRALDATVTAADSATYVGQWPAIALEKRVNGQDADVCDGPSVIAGSTLSFTFAVTNTGDVRLTGVAVSDSAGLVVTCPKTTLEPGESMTCTASAVAVAGQHSNVGTAVGTPASGPSVTATDPACYRGVTPSIAIEKLTNGNDADVPPGPTIAVGAPVLWVYVATNTGEVAIAQLSVTDNRGVTVTCPKTALQPGETMTCTASGTAVAGQYSNVGTVTGQPEVGPAISAQDPSHYFGWSPGSQGCTPGYWKNHTDSWPPTGYSVSQKVLSVFGEASRYPSSGNATLLAALGFAGGSGVAGAAEILLRAAVAALLNAAHPGVAYPRPPATVVPDVDVALASGSRDTMLSLAAALDADNNRGCPLN